MARWIDWCARNRFLVFTGTVLLVLAGVWAMNRIPLDALPDISDVEVIIHTPWEEPPNIIEDQVTYPIVTALLAAPSVKAVRAQTKSPVYRDPPHTSGISAEKTRDLTTQNP